MYRKCNNVQHLKNNVQKTRVAVLFYTEQKEISKNPKQELEKHGVTERAMWGQRNCPSDRALRIL